MVCQDCGVESPTRNRKCPSCGCRDTVALRCADCPLTRIDELCATSKAGELLAPTYDLDFNTQNFEVPWSDVSALHAKCLKILRQESQRYQLELQNPKHKEIDWAAEAARRKR